MKNPPNKLFGGYPLAVIVILVIVLIVALVILIIAVLISVLIVVLVLIFVLVFHNLIPPNCFRQCRGNTMPTFLGFILRAK